MNERMAMEQVDADAASSGGGRLSGRSAGQRPVAGVLLCASLGVLLVAASLDPAPAGYGTHESLGLPACGFKSFTTLPCVTCGMTTAFSHAANGHLLTAFQVQPAGMLLAVLTAMAAVVSGLSLGFGFSLAPLGRMLGNMQMLVALAGLLLGGWIYTLLQTIG